jgi:hypothetical protein
MKHLSDQEWMEFLYEEMSPDQKKTARAHIRSCADCQKRQKELVVTTAGLDAWKVEAPARPELKPQFFPAAKWAAAVAILATTAFAAGRWSKPALDPAEIESQISRPLQDKIERIVVARLETSMQTQFAAKVQEASDKLLAESTAAYRRQIEQLSVQLAALRDEDKKAVYASFRGLEEQRASDYRRLREDLEKVALFSDQSFRGTQRELVKLATLASNP